MIVVDYAGNSLVVEAGPRDTRLLKQIPGARFIRSKDRWVMPATPGQFAILHAMFGDVMDTTPESTPVLDGFIDFAAKQEKARTASAPIKGREKLFPFQAAGTKFLGHGKTILMADEMGTGKTVQSLTAVDIRNAYPLLIVCPNSMKHVWAREVERWTSATAIVVGGSAAHRRKMIETAQTHVGYPVAVIINYEALRLHTKLASFGNRVLTVDEATAKELNEFEWGSVIADEAHKVKEPKAKQTRALWGVSGGSDLRIALTGTPIMNNPDDLWAIMRFVKPDLWPERSRFRDRYCDVRPGWHGGLENEGLVPERIPELDRALQPYFIRRTKAEVLPDLPPKTITDQYLDLSTKQRTAYNKMVKHMMADLETGLLMAADPLTLLGRLRYLASAYAEIDDDGNVTALTTPSNKLDAVEDILEEGGVPLVVYAESRKLIELLDTKLSDSYRTGLITGKVAPAMRAANIELFQAGKLDLILATTGAGAEGVTLTAADRLVMAQESWSNVANKQAHDRIHRIGQERNVEIITLISEGTIDEAVHQATAEKEEQLQRLVRDPAWLAAAMRGEL